jgi:hypothetical protein
MKILAEEYDWSIVYITVLSKKDDLGRQCFMLQWMDNNIGQSQNEIGLRGQIFLADLSERIQSIEAKRNKVEFTQASLV